nr:SDR family oxidoreductase [uncultured Allomuricauda sp.]
MKKVALLGCNGYLGSHLSYYLTVRGYKVNAYDIHDDSFLRGIGSYTQIDISTGEGFKGFDFEVDYVYYFSGVTGTGTSLDEYSRFIDINEKGLLHILNGIKQQKVHPRIVFPSTRLVYKGVKNTPLNEEAEKEFKTIYALNKYHNEASLDLFNNYYNIPYTIFRIGVPYGNTLDRGYSYGTIGFFLDKARNNRPITLYGDGLLRRTFTHVSDICRQIVTVSELEKSIGEIYNIGGETYSLLEIAKKIARKYDIAIKHVDWPDFALALESGDTVFDASKINKLVQPVTTESFPVWIDKQ